MKPALEALVADARRALDSDGELIAQVRAEAPRFELFSAANSVCSQKVRAVLAHHGQAYRSHSLNLFGGTRPTPPVKRSSASSMHRSPFGCSTIGLPWPISIGESN